MTKLLVVAAFAAFAFSGCNDTTLVEAIGPAPVAVIAADASYAPLFLATFDGHGSHDSTGPIASYAWEIVTRPEGSQSLAAARVSDPALADFFVDLAGEYAVKLVVTDGDGLTGETTWRFSAIPSQQLHLELLWPGQYTHADLDLHLVDRTAGGTLWDADYDCYFSTCKSAMGRRDWGVTGNLADDPSLDIDNINQSVPENINIAQPADGTYEIDVHYYGSSDAVDPPVEAEVRVFLMGSVAHDAHRVFSAVGQVWTVANVVCAGGACTIVPLDTMGTTSPGG